MKVGHATVNGREEEMLRLLTYGSSNPEMAAKLMVSRETIKSGLKTLFRKLGVQNRTQAAVMFVRETECARTGTQTMPPSTVRNAGRAAMGAGNGSLDRDHGRQHRTY